MDHGLEYLRSAPDQPDDEGTSDDLAAAWSELSEYFSVDLRLAIKGKLRTSFGRLGVKPVGAVALDRLQLSASVSFDGRRPQFWQEPKYVLAIESPNKQAPLRKITYTPDRKLLCIHSAKLEWRIVCLSFVAGFNLATKRPLLQYRLRTIWNAGPEVSRKNKLNFQCYDVKGRSKLSWNIHSSFPAIDGSFGEQGGADTDVELGKIEFCLKKLSTTLDW